MFELGLRARLVVFNDSCPMCGKTLPSAIGARRVSRALDGDLGSQCVVSFRCHRGACSAWAIGSGPLDLEGLLHQEVRELEVRYVDELDSAPPPDELTFFQARAPSAQHPHQEHS